ncbi:MAG: NADP-dependent isocitrate dehydrogenase, partial [Enterobacterales bacterium]|nr:NADP-dependent isocitrate dehydrogenase [Enterobacterales bacterium]
FLMNNRSPSRKVNEIDNRGSHFYLAMYWAKALAEQIEDSGLATTFEAVYAEMASHEAQINAELLMAQGRKIDIGGYYLLDDDLVSKAMRPSMTLNQILSSLG